MLIRSHLSSNHRPGVVLLVVMALLSLFATVGLSFVFYADAEAVASKYAAQSLVKDEPEVNPEVLSAYFLNQFLYDTPNNQSAMRGWSLARSIYGYNPAALNFIPYNGIGRAALGGPVPGFATDNYNLINYQKYSIPNWNNATQYVPGNAVRSGGNAYLCTAANVNNGPPNASFWALLPNDPYLNFDRTPEFFGKVGDPNYRYVGGANPAWTSYDTNSIFLAQVLADGTVVMPSFFRPWVTGSAPPGTADTRYASLSPDPAWNPVFAAHLAQYDADPDGICHVRNLDVGPGRLMLNGQLGNNDSRWMDVGFPIMTAPNGKRYKALFAPLVMDLSNRLHLYAHGNRRGGTAAAPSHVSNQGLGATEVSVMPRMPGVAANIAPNGAVSLGGPAPVMITTTTPHGFSAGQSVVISGVRNNGYNGTFTIANVPAPTATTFRIALKGKLTPSGFGTVMNAELVELFNYKYGGFTGTTASAAVGTLITYPIVRGGLWHSMLDFDARGLTNVANGEQGVSSRPMHTSFSDIQTIAPVGAGTNPVTVNQISGTSYGGFHWSLYPGMQVTIVDPVPRPGPPPQPPRTETVTITNVDYVNRRFTANFTVAHAAGKQVKFGSPTQSMPYYPLGWDNVTGAGETTAHPMALDLQNAIAPNTVPKASSMEALLRWGGTNSPAVTDEIFRRLPSVLSTLRARSMYTTVNWKLDRIGGYPMLAFDRDTPGNYLLDPSAGYPKLTTLPALVPDPKAAGPNYGLPFALNTAKSDFGPDWRSSLGNQLRVNLNRRLTDYPAPAPATGIIAVNAQFTAAQTERQTLAKDIYNALVRVTGARDPNVVGTNGMIIAIQGAGATPPGASVAGTTATIQTSGPHGFVVGQNVTVSGVAVPGYNGTFTITGGTANSFTYTLPAAVATGLPTSGGGVVTSLDYQAARWLAQLAVNIVDYIDADDYSTPFQWYGAEYVFGTELPRLVLNEVYAQHETAPTRQINVWAELHNPFKPIAAGTYPWLPLDDNSAVLQHTTATVPNPPYILEIHRSTASLTATLRDPTNTVGSGPGAAAPLGIQNDWGTTATSIRVLPGNGVTTSGTTLTRTIQPDNPNPAVAGASIAGAVVTIRTMGAHGFTVGQAVTITGVQNGGASVAGYEGTFVIASTTANSFTFNAPGIGALPTGGGGTASVRQNGNQGFYVIGPANARYSNPNRHPHLLATHASQDMKTPDGAFTIRPNVAGMPGASQVGTTVTIETTAAHNFHVGDIVRITGVAPDNGYNGVKQITGVPTPTSFTYTAPAGLMDSGGGNVTPANVTILLRRLANPHRPFNATTNPYITVDYLDGVPIQQGVATSIGRKQPYAAHPTQNIAQTGSTLPGQPQNSFFLQNTGIEANFDWLVHLDRPLVNPIELLHVSSKRPHELTQEFKKGANRFGHYAPWADPAANIYRVIELLGTANHMAGTFNGGRHPGPINLNTLTDPEVLIALADPQDHNQPNPLFRAFYSAAAPSDRFIYNPGNAGDPNALFTKVIASRNNVASLIPTSEGNPFQPTSANSLLKTFFRPDPTAPGQTLFGIGATNDHPYHQAALMQKIYNNVTTTSNCFAVWWTVGFFEVVDETVKPARLGAEIGRDLNRHVRHRFFAIVDRSAMEFCRVKSTNNAAGTVTVNLANALPQSRQMRYLASSLSIMGKSPTTWNATQGYVPGDVVIPPGGPANLAVAYFCIQANTNIPVTNTAYWQPVIQPGMLLEVGAPGATEVVAVKAVAGNQFTADFTMNHAADSLIIVRGNPGPQPVYSPRRDANVVLHLSVIQ